MIKPIPNDVILRSSKSGFIGDANIYQMNGKEFQQQNYNKVTTAQHIELKETNSSGEKSINICLFRLQCALRLGTSFGEKNEKIFFELIADFDVPYPTENEVTQKEIEDFSDSESILKEVWPYWKEHAHSICLRSGMTSIKLPHFNQLKKMKFNRVETK